MIAPIVFALADRFCGGPWVERWGWRGRPIYYAGAVVLLLGLTPVLSLPAALAWVLWRWPGWAPGKMDPQTPRELVLTFVRHCIPLVALPWAPGLLLFPLIATALGYWLGRERGAGRDRTVAVELTRGAAYGLLAAL